VIDRRDIPDWVTEGSYSSTFYPAGATSRARKKYLDSFHGRKGGIISAKRKARRRELARMAGIRPHRHERTRPLALGRAYPKMWQLNADAFEALYRATCDREGGWTFDRRGLNTAWALYLILWRWYRRYGQDFEFTNTNMADALKARGRPRKERTVQLTRKRLEAMGVLAFAWVKRGTWQRDRGWCPGKRKDTVRATVLHISRPRRANCIPPTGAGASVVPPSAPCSSSQKKIADATASDPDPPPSAADEAGALAGAKRPATEREELERALRFQQLKLDAGWDAERTTAELLRLRQRLRLLGGGP
jgi:hypothetical protein